MNRKYLIGLLVTAAVIALLAAIVLSLFEIYPETRAVPPSREARVNEYLALDRWLESSGISVRVENSGDASMISAAREMYVFLRASLFKWDEETPEYLTRWIEEGGNLFLVLDFLSTAHDGDSGTGNAAGFRKKLPLLLIAEFGITAKMDTAGPGFRYDPESPDMDNDISFEVSNFEISEDGDVLTMNDWAGLTRFVQVKQGKGTLTVSGPPLFLYSPHIGKAPNARLASAIFLEDFAAGGSRGAGKDGWLFIRGEAKVSGLFGTLWRQGNLPALLAALFVLLVVGFWAVIPMFGLVRGEGEKPGKPLRERFLAEGRFLKRYGALELYRELYKKEIKRRLVRREGLSGDSEVIKRTLEIWGRPPEERSSVLLLRALSGERFTNREFPKMITIFNTILERI